MKLYEGGKQYNCKANLWKAIKTTISETESAELKKLTKSMDNRLVAAIERKGHYIKILKDSKTYHMCLLFVLLLVLQDEILP